MLADHEITRDELFAVGATFTLVAWGFAYVFVVWQAIEPGSFIAAVDPEAQRTWMELLFLSFTTLSSTGLSDVVPVEPFARGLVMIEQLAGVAYRRRGLPARGPDDPAAGVMDGFRPTGVRVVRRPRTRQLARTTSRRTRDFYEDEVRGGAGGSAARDRRRRGKAASATSGGPPATASAPT